MTTRKKSLNESNMEKAEQLVRECGITAPYENLLQLVKSAMEWKDSQSELLYRSYLEEREKNKIACLIIDKIKNR